MLSCGDSDNIKHRNNFSKDHLFYLDRKSLILDILGNSSSQSSISFRNSNHRDFAFKSIDDFLSRGLVMSQRVTNMAIL